MSEAMALNLDGVLPKAVTRDDEDVRPFYERYEQLRGFARRWLRAWHGFAATPPGSSIRPCGV